MKGSKFFVVLLVLYFSLTSAVFADTLKYGNRGAEVTGLQKQLSKLGYFKGSATGYFGSKTQEAVKKFQSAKGISTTGTVGPQTAKALSAAGTSSGSAIAGRSSETDRTALRKVQEILTKLGLYKGKIDGLNGKQTISAVREFQKRFGMAVTGSLDKKTESKIINHYASTATSSRGFVSASTVQGARVQRATAVTEELQSESNDMSASETETEAHAEAAAEAESSLEAEAVSELADDEELDEAPVEDHEEETAEEPDETGANGKIEVLDWWKAANKVFARGSNAKVIDVRTGKSFYIKRTYGGNHADCETLTKEDTKIMKEIWGGFNWSRRPVLVEVNGRLLAASMSGMPHAGLDNKATNAIVSGRSAGYGRGVNLDAVKNNGMDGHFDIHFKNSRTHGSNRVDSAHQKTIEEAAAAKF